MPFDLQGLLSQAGAWLGSSTIMPFVGYSVPNILIALVAVIIVAVAIARR